MTSEECHEHIRIIIMTLRMTTLDVLLQRIPEDRRFFLDVKTYGSVDELNSLLRFIKNRWPGCEGVSICYDLDFLFDLGILDEQFRVEVFPMYGPGGFLYLEE
ncbi:MAG TPA: hypothetical protein ENI23_11040 [bacterium]|nr:hypothetical protein [bacterium]